MTIDTTHQYRPTVSDDANLQHIQDAADNINNLKDNAVDTTTGNVNASSVIIDADATVNGDRSLIFKLTSSLSRILKYASGSGRMRLEDQAGSLVGLEVADATQTTQATTLAQLNVAKLITVVSKSANYTAVAADINNLFSCTSTFTLALTAAATLANGWHCEVRNDGTGVITIDPNSSETIDGLATLKLYPGEAFTVVCDGSNFKTVGRQRGRILLGKQDVISGSPVSVVDFTSFITSDFDQYILEGDSVVPVTDGVNAYLRGSTNGGSSYLAGTEYSYQHIGTDATSTPSSGNDHITLNRVTIGNADGEGIDFEVKLIKPSGSQAIKAVRWWTDERNTSNGPEGHVGGANIATSSAINAFRFLFSGGNIAQGGFSLWGVRKA